MEVLLAIAGVLILAWLNSWNERRLTRRVQDSLDKAMGRKDKDQN
jgi:hypothetical protein